MYMSIVQITLLIAGAYVVTGAVFASAFVTLGVSRLDHAASGAPWSFRVLIWPGVAALWPVMLSKWLAARRRAEQST